jgi:uncharacterized protein YecT (DUF1311 family)
MNEAASGVAATFRGAAVLSVAILFGLAEAALADEPLDCANPMTQSELNQCAGDSYQNAETEMSRLYAQIIAQHADDRAFVDAFERAQEAWLAYRDAEYDAQFPPPQSNVHYGSVLPMCSSSFAEAMAHERIARLRQWIDGVEEGDVCAGSLPSR